MTPDERARPDHNASQYHHFEICCNIVTVAMLLTPRKSLVSKTPRRLSRDSTLSAGLCMSTVYEPI